MNKEQRKEYMREYSKAWRASNKEKIKADRKAYKEANREEINRKAREAYAKNPEKMKAYQKEYRKNNPEKMKARAKKYRAKNAEKIAKQVKSYQEKNRDAIREYKNEWRSQPTQAIRERVANKIRKCISRSKRSRSLEKDLGYTVPELLEHLERQFVDGMSWENCSEWHIDHIIPVSSFEYSSPKDEEFKRCWALSNLRPLWAKDNLVKNARVEFLV